MKCGWGFLEKPYLIFGCREPYVHFDPVGMWLFHTAICTLNLCGGVAFVCAVALRFSGATQSAGN